MPESSHTITQKNGAVADRWVGVCAAGVRDTIWRLVRDRLPFKWRVQTDGTTFTSSGILSYLLLDSKVTGVEWSIGTDGTITIVYTGAAGVTSNGMCFLWQVLRQFMERPDTWREVERKWSKALELDDINKRDDDEWLHAVAWLCFTYSTNKYGQRTYNQGHTFRVSPLFHAATPESKEAAALLVNQPSYSTMRGTERGFNTSTCWGGVREDNDVVSEVATILGAWRVI